MFNLTNENELGEILFLSSILMLSACQTGMKTASSDDSVRQSDPRKPASEYPANNFCGYVQSLGGLSQKDGIHVRIKPCGTTSTTGTVPTDVSVKNDDHGMQALMKALDNPKMYYVCFSRNQDTQTVVSEIWRRDAQDCR